MVTATQRSEVARAGRAAAGSGLHVVVVAGVVVGTAAAGGSGAPRENAGAVAERDLLGDPVGYDVTVDLDTCAEVEHRLHDNLGVGPAAPRSDLCGGDQRLAALEVSDRVVA